MLAGLPFAQLRAQDLAQVGKQKPLSLQTNLSLNTSFYAVSGIAARQEPFSWTTAGALTLGVYGLQLPLSFVFSEHERSFAQPFDQFGMSPTYKWLTLHGGYRSLTFSPLTLAGHTILGGGIELNPRWLRSGFIIGRFERAVQADTTDTLHTREPAFTRWGWAAKLGFGKPDNYADLIVLKSWDDTSSVKLRHDSTVGAPEENLVIGLSTRNTLFKVVTLTLDAAVSGHTRDRFAMELGSSKSSTLEALRWILDPNLSTTLGTAISANVDAVLNQVSLNAQYKRTDAEFASFGAYFTESDVQAWSVTPSVSLIGQKLRLTGSLGMQNDNLSHNKVATTDRWRILGGVSVMPAPLWGVDVQYANLTTDQKPGTVDSLKDSTRLDQTNHQLTLAPHASFVGASLSGSGSLAYSWSYLHDRNDLTRPTSRSQAHTVTLAGQLTPKVLDLGIAPSLSYAWVQAATVTNQVAGFSLGLNRLFLEHTLRTDLVNTFSWSILNASAANFVYTGRLNCGYTLLKHHTANISAVYTHSAGSTAQAKSFDEFSGNLGYTLSF
jgi:hypothetical protein